MKIFKLYFKLLIMLVILPCASLGVVNANEFVSRFNDSSSEHFTVARSYSPKQTNNVVGRSEIGRSEVIWSNTISQNRSGNIRSRSEVIREVKNRYDAEVLRISLSKNGRHYNVRVLMPNGKVKNIQVNAER
jgi:uncharacterized membrane protein YkoI